ncbi:MAG: gliding motility lipoprotein GldH [Flavobacteriaceae bacterium]|nr:gliding motility lipoprotein GldH [Flavobacteriaceae bacterium]
MSKVSFILFFSIFLLSMFSCRQKNFYFEEVANIKNQWRSDDVKSFKFPVKENDKKFTIYFIIRNNNSYKYSNIYFFTSIKSPDGEIITDTLEYQLAYPNGKWMGFGMGEIKQNTLVFKENMALKDTGIYQVNIVQAMRETDLEGIEDISLMIEKN